MSTYQKYGQNGSWQFVFLTICLCEILPQKKLNWQNVFLTKCLTKYVLTKCLPDKTSNKNPWQNVTLTICLPDKTSADHLFSVSPRLAMEFCLLRTSASYWSYLSTGLDPGIQLIQSIRFQGFPRWREMLWEIRGWMEDLLWAGWTKLNNLKTWLKAKSKTLPGSLSDDTGTILRLKGCIWVEKLLLLQRTPLRNKQILTNLTETVADYKMWT